MHKSWLNYSEQVALLSKRGLSIPDPAAAKHILSQVSYYRLSGYFRYWQIDPTSGDNRFIEGSRFDTIRDLYSAEQNLLLVCDEVLHPIEVLLRTRFAHHYAELVGPLGLFAQGEGFTQPSDPAAPRVEERVLTDLDRSKEAFVTHYRDEIRAGSTYAAAAYARMPIWVAVEALSFGTLSRLIEASGKSGVLVAVADSMKVSPKTLPSQIRSFVYLRNRIAHCATLWNHSVLDVPGLLPNISRRAKRAHGQFSDHSIYKILVALDDVASKAGITPDWLTQRVDPILKSNPLLAAGIADPQRYGGMPVELLAPSAE